MGSANLSEAAREDRRSQRGARGLLALLLLAMPVAAQVKVGDRAPRIDVARLVNTRVRSLAELEGRLVMYVYLDPAGETASATVKHLNNLLAKWGRKGFAIVAVFRQPLADVQRFADREKLRAIVALERGTPSHDLFGFADFPAAFLAGPTGQVVWIGHPRDLSRDDVEIALRKVRAGFPAGAKLTLELRLPKPYAEIEKLMARGELGKAHAALAAELGKPGLDEVDEALLEEARRELLGLLELERADAERAEETRRWYEALTLWRRIVTHFEGLEAATQAQGRAEAIEKNPRIADELEAGRRIAEAEDLLAKKQDKKARELLEALLEGPLGKTREAQRAKPLLEELR